MLALFMNKLNIVRFPDYKVYGLSCAKFKKLSYVYQNQSKENPDIK